MRYAAAMIALLIATSARADWMNDMQLVARVRTRAAVSLPAYPTNGLVAYWSMDDVSGTTVEDAFGANDGTATNGVLFGADYGKVANGSDFDGVNDYIDVPAAAPLDFASFTASFWARPSTTNTARVLKGLLARYSTGNNKRIWIIAQRDEKIEVFIGNSGGTSGALQANVPGVLSSSVFRHVVVSFQDETGVNAVYINGESVSFEDTQTYTSLNQLDTDQTLAIGSYSVGGSPFDGSIDEVAIWNRALTTNEIAIIYNDGNGRTYP